MIHPAVALGWLLLLLGLILTQVATLWLLLELRREARRTRRAHRRQLKKVRRRLRALRREVRTGNRQLARRLEGQRNRLPATLQRQWHNEQPPRGAAADFLRSVYHFCGQVEAALYLTPHTAPAPCQALLSALTDARQALERDHLTLGRADADGHQRAGRLHHDCRLLYDHTRRYAGGYLELLQQDAQRRFLLDQEPDDPTTPARRATADLERTVRVQDYLNQPARRHLLDAIAGRLAAVRGQVTAYARWLGVADPGNEI